MYEYYSVGDGFVEITENLGELVTYVANEPSVGLYYIQQHAKEAATSTVNLNSNVIECSHETSLQTDDLKDSIAAVSAMKECGIRITDDMIGDIEKSLSMILTKQRSGWMQHAHTSSFQIGRARSWIPTMLSQSAGDVRNDNMSNLLSMVLGSAKGKAEKFKWQGIHLDNAQETKEDRPLPDLTPSSSTEPDNEETDELPLSVQSAWDNYKVFKADRNVRLEEWLEDSKPPDSLRSI